MGFQFAFDNLKLDTQVHLDGLPVKIKGFLGNHSSPDSKILFRLFHGRTGKIAKPVTLKIPGKPLERLLIPPCRTDTVDPAVIAVIMWPLAKRNFSGNSVSGLGTG
jgi:hypothetical protein